MRKTYIKPMITFESFKITTNVAGNCRYDAQFSADTCAYVDSIGVSFFTDKNNSCGATPQDGDENSYCYHAPYDTNNIFGS